MQRALSSSRGAGMTTEVNILAIAGVRECTTTRPAPTAPASKRLRNASFATVTSSVPAA